MQTKSKLLFIVAIMLLGLGAATIVNVSLNFRDYSINSAIEKAKTTATIVKDGLTSHMVNGIMDKRQYFLDQISNNDEVKSLWIVRSNHVIKQYGPGFNNENIRDAIDKKVLTTGKMVQEVSEHTDKIILRVTIPYKATSTGNPNCLTCHNVERNDTLGAVSMEFDISSMRNTGMMTIIKILGINIIFVIIALILINHYVTPYMRLFTNLQEGITKAYSGDFTHVFKTTVTGEDAKEIVSQINTLFRKMQDTFGDIKYNLSTFIPQGCVSSIDPLYEAKIIIGELSDIYKFKKTIELDQTKENVYSRIVDTLKVKFKIKDFVIYEVDTNTKQRTIMYSSGKDTSICDRDVDKNASKCRAHRTQNEVISTEFVELCKNCTAGELNYICIPFTITVDTSLVISITSADIQEIERVHTQIMSIENYLEAAKPVIESKILMSKLLDTSLRDAMTGLYNRRFLEEFIDKIMSQALREKETYSVMMLDVDFFKSVNDTYGHDAGDLVIQEIGKLLLGSIRESDLAIRYGGEEFVVMLHNSDEKGTLKVANDIHSNFAKLVFEVGNGVTLQKTLSIGIATFPNDGDTIWKAIKYADTALYVAKTTGRNKVVEYTKEMSESETLR